MKTASFSKEAMIKELTMMVIIEFESRMRRNNVHLQRDILDSYIELQLMPVVRTSVLRYLSETEQSHIVLVCRCQSRDTRQSLVHLIMEDVSRRLLE